MTAVQQLTPAQQRTLSVLRRGDEPVVFDRAFIAELHEIASEAMAHFAERLGGDTLFVTKHSLGAALDCEAMSLAPDEFTWSPARARGQVTHKALQLLLNWSGEPVPAELVDEALARLEVEERGLSDWLGHIGAAPRAELRGHSTDMVTKFLECFPPLEARWRPVPESATQWPVDGAVLLRARADLAIGVSVGTESRKVIIDFKTGRAVPRHREDLWFYALVETLSREIPPRRVASLYLDAAQPVADDVTEATLRTALRRTLDGVDRIVALRSEARAPTKNPGAFCRWCAVFPDCDEGRSYVELMGGS